MSKFSRSEIGSRLKKIISEVTNCDEALLTFESRLLPDENSDRMFSVDSLELAELLITVEEEFKISIPDKEVSQLGTLGHLVNYVIEKSNS